MANLPFIKITSQDRIRRNKTIDISVMDLVKTGKTHS